MTDAPVIAAFRPPGDRAEAAASLIENAGGVPLLDPMVSPEATGDRPRTDADVTIFTSSTVADLPSMEGWLPDGGDIAAIGPKTEAALESIGIEVDIVPPQYTSGGLVEALASTVDGTMVEVARSDHGSDELIEGLNSNGAYVHETILYRLIRPSDAGNAVTATLDGDVDALAFTSSLTVEHFLEIAAERGQHDALMESLAAVTIGAIGPPTAETATAAGLSVDVVAGEATFESLVEDIMAELGRDS